MNILLGDIHGNVKVLMTYIHRGYADDGCIFQIGDFGLYDMETDWGIPRETLEDLDKQLGEHNTKLRVIRGNHDCPKYWINDDERNKFNKTYQNIELLKDYHVEELDGVKCMFIGGAVSVDRKTNIEDISWWADEVVQVPQDGVESLPEVDVVIAHNCPSFFNLGCDANSPSLKYWSDGDDTLVEDLIAERYLLDTIFEQVKPARWFSGHFHNHIKDERDGCQYRCININELYSVDSFIPFKNLPKT